MWYFVQMWKLSDTINFQQMACHFILPYMMLDVWISFITCQQADSWAPWSRCVCSTYIHVWVCTAGDMNWQAWMHMSISRLIAQGLWPQPNRIYLDSTYALAATYIHSLKSTGVMTMLPQFNMQQTARMHKSLAFPSHLSLFSCFNEWQGDE